MKRSIRYSAWSRMRPVFSALAVGLALLGMSTATLAQDEAPSQGTADEIVLCGKCGQIKGSAECCKADAAKCSKCGLIRGSPGCCKLSESGKDVTLCAKCGQVKGSDLCCKADAVKCGKCGLAKGSPGCCKLSKPE